MKHTCIPSLSFQTRRPVVHIAINPNDPTTEEKLSLLKSTGCEIRPIFRDNWKLYGENWELPEGRKLVSRMDDDDVLAKDFCQKTYEVAPSDGEYALIWPCGYVFWRATCFLLEHPGIQFVSIVTDRQTDPHSEQHWQYHKNWPTIVVSREVGWIWVRHGAASTSTLPRYRRKKLKGIDANRIPINLRAILRATDPCGVASGNYTEHKNQLILQHVIAENSKNKPKKDTP